MTIKPILVTTAPKRGVGATDSSNSISNEEATHSNLECSVTSAVGANDVQQLAGLNAGRSNAVHVHRNVVLDVKPQLQRNDRQTLFEEHARNQRTIRNNFVSTSVNVRVKRQQTRERVEQNRDRLRGKSGSPVGPAIPRKSNEILSTVSGSINTTAQNCNAVGVNGTNNNGVNLLQQANDNNNNINNNNSSNAINNTINNNKNNKKNNIKNSNNNDDDDEEAECSGYNSGDEHVSNSKDGNGISVEEWKIRDEKFVKLMSERGFTVKTVEEDGACLFRSISLQIYGDEGMHDIIRQNTMDYIYKNREYFCHFVTEDINSYIKRKRRKDSHGNHIEIQAMSEIYSRPVEVYCYEPTPINIFNSEQLANGYAPLRLSYQRVSHYNAILDPYNATVGVGLGLAGYKPELQTKEAQRLSEQLEIEQTMFEDKLKTTDWEATNEAIEEQIARESYLQWCRDNLNRSQHHNNATATITSAQINDAAPSNKNSMAITTTTSTRTATTTATATAFSTATTLSPKACEAKATDDDTYGDADNDANDNDASSEKILGSTLVSCSKGSKKRRRDNTNCLLHNESSSSDGLLKESAQSLSSRKNAKYGNNTTNDLDVSTEKPSTSKQSSSSPNHIISANGGSVLEAHEKPESSLYAELLEASFAINSAVPGSLSDAEMLQRAIQLSREDYLNDQKRNFIFSMGNNSNNKNNNIG